MTQKKLNRTVYVITGNLDTLHDIETMTYAEYLREYWADECNTPRGTAPRLFVEMKERTVWTLPDGTTFDTDNGNDEDDVQSYIEAHNDEEGADGDRWPADPESYSVTLDEYEIRRWMPNGRHRLVETYTTEEEAERELYLYWERSYHTESRNAPEMFDTFDEARDVIAEQRNIPRSINMQSA